MQHRNQTALYGYTNLSILTPKVQTARQGRVDAFYDSPGERVFVMVSTMGDQGKVERWYLWILPFDVAITVSATHFVQRLPARSLLAPLSCLLFPGQPLFGNTLAQ
jgi:hypothetical protein